MKYAVYKAISPLGYPVDLMTDGKEDGNTWEKVFEDEPMRIMAIEKLGAKVLKDVPQEVKPTPQATTVRPGYCLLHDVEMEKKEGKFGTFYSHYKEVNGIKIYCNGKGYKE